MKNRLRVLAFLSCLPHLFNSAQAQDWPQWLGPDRDAKASFDVPDSWPEALSEKWKVSVGNGVATPALVGDKLFVFTRVEGNEVVRCLNADTGEQLWQDDYEAAAAGGAARSFPGPRSSPGVADGKVVTLGASGTLSCYDAESGKLLWRNAEHVGDVPRFFASSSPLLIDGMCVSQFGSNEQGGVVAHDLSTGEEQWKWTAGSTSYGSPALMMLGNTKVLLAPTANSLVTLDAATGKQLGEMDLQQGRYNAASPMVYGQTAILGGPGRGMMAVKFELAGGQVTNDVIWKNADEVTNTQYNSPILKGDLVFGVSMANVLFCINASSSETAWANRIGADGGGGSGAQGRGGQGGARRAGQGGDRGGAGQQRGGQGRGSQGRGRQAGGRRRGGGGGGYGSIVDAGSVLLGLTPAGELFVFAPSGETYSEIAKYKVADADAYAYPIATGNRIFIKDADHVTLWTLN